MRTGLLLEEPRSVGGLEKGINVLLHVEDEHGNRILSKKANTLVTAFFKYLFVQMSTINVSAVDVAGVARTISEHTNGFAVNAGVGDTSLGIVLGTGTAPVSITDFKLQSLIPHGTGAGQLQYSSVSVTPVEIIGNMIRFYVTRLVTNLSGADITVNEVGLIIPQGGSPYKFLADRTLVTFVVPDGGSRNIIYEFRVVV